MQDGHELTLEQRAWVEARERLWQRAEAIAECHPGMDVGGLYHALCNLQKTPGERLKEALARGRLFRLHRR